MEVYYSLFHQQMFEIDIWWVPYLDLRDVVDSMVFHFSAKHRKDGNFKVHKAVGLGGPKGPKKVYQLLKHFGSTLLSDRLW